MKKEKVQKMFDAIASDYDKLNHIMSLDADKGWRRRALKYICDERSASQESGSKTGNVSDGRQALQVLDVACGTGDFSITIARALPEGSKVTGIDLSGCMLEIMRGKVEKEGLREVIFCEQGDSENMRFADESFDRETIAFGIRNFENREQGLKEILRVLKHGGRLVILELSLPENPIIRMVYKLYFTKILPFIGGKVSGKKAAYKYLPASVLAFPKHKEWVATMESCGYTNVLHKSLTFGICRLYAGEKS